MTRRNDRDLAVANRDTWTITGIDPDGTITVHGEARTGSRALPAGYVHEHVELAYATTVHGAQGETAHTGHLLLGRAHHRRRGVRRDDPRPRGQRRPPGRREPRRRPRAMGRDLRPRPSRSRARARRPARSRGSRKVRPTPPTRGRTRRPPCRLDHEQDLRHALARCESSYDFMAADGAPPAAWATDNRAEREELRDELSTATNQMRALLLEPAIRSLPPGRIEQEHADWLQDRHHEQQLAQADWETGTYPRPNGRHPTPGYPSTADRGRGISR